MKRYAFIDVQNTETTTRKLLGFDVDWLRLVEYLKNTKSCSEVYLYTGINNDIKDKISKVDSKGKGPA